MEPIKPRIERQVAKKLWIREIVDGELQVTEGLQPNVLVTSRGEAGRVNILGVVVDTQMLPTATLRIDDGSAVIAVRSFERPLNQNVGDFVQIIGRPRVYQGEAYIAAEGAAVISPAWAAYRKAELGDPTAAAPRPIPVIQPIVAAIERETTSERLIKLIIQLDRGDGAPIEDVVAKSNITNAEAVITQLLLAGDIFELRPGKIKVL